MPQTANTTSGKLAQEQNMSVHQSVELPPITKSEAQSVLAEHQAVIEE